MSDEKLLEIKARIDENLDCTIERFVGVHRSKIAVSIDVFETVYAAASTLSRLIAEMPYKHDNATCGWDGPSEQDIGYSQGYNALRQTIINIICEEMK